MVAEVESLVEWQWLENHYHREKNFKFIIKLLMTYNRLYKVASSNDNAVKISTFQKDREVSVENMACESKNCTKFSQRQCLCLSWKILMIDVVYVPLWLIVMYNLFVCYTVFIRLTLTGFLFACVSICTNMVFVQSASIIVKDFLYVMTIFCECVLAIFWIFML